MAKMKRISPIRAVLADYYTHETGEKINFHSENDQLKLNQFLHSHKEILLHTFAPVLQNKQTVREILQLYTRDQWAEVLIGIRQKYGLEKIPLKDVLSLIEYDGAHGYKIIKGDADRFIESTIHEHKYQLDIDNIKVPGIDHTINHQLDTWVAELVSNALDATVPEKSIGKFGSGFLSCLATLGKEAETITVITKKKGGTPYKLEFTQKRGEIFIQTSRADNESIHKYGTTIIMQRNGIPIDDKALLEQLSWKFSTNTTAPIIINGKQINQTDSLHREKTLHFNSEKPVKVKINDSSVVVHDEGVGMDAHGLLYHLLFPKSGTKQPISYTNEELTSMIHKEVTYGYKIGDSDKTTVRCQIAGVTIESFDLPKQGNVEQLSVVFPSATYLPEARNQIVGTKEVLLSLQYILSTLANSNKPLQTKVDLLGSFAHLIRTIDERRTTEGQSKELSLIKYSQKDIYPRLEEDIKKAGKKSLPANPHLKAIIGPTDSYIFVDALFLGQINPLDLPHAAKIDNIIAEKVVTKKVHGKNIPFYSCRFDQSSPHDYVIFSHFVVVNDKYIDDDKNMALLNTSINLNIHYELEEDMVYYGTIVTKQEIGNSKKALANGDDRNDKTEKQEIIDKAINSPEIIERFYSEIIEQIDIEYNGLWTLMKKHNTTCDHEAKCFTTDVKLDQYLVNEETKDRGMQMMLWWMSAMSGQEIYDITLPLPENCKNFIHFMKNQSAEHVYILHNFIHSWANTIPYEENGGHASHEEIAQFFNICATESSPGIIKQLMDIIKRYKWEENSSNSTFDIFKNLDEWKRNPNNVEKHGVIKKYGINCIDAFDPYNLKKHPEMMAGNIEVGGTTITIARSDGIDCDFIEGAIELQGCEIKEFTTYAEAIDYISNHYLGGKVINGENINTFLDSIGHNFPGYVKESGNNKFSYTKNRYLWLPVKVRNRGLLYMESNTKELIKYWIESCGDAYPILSENIIEEPIEQQPNKKETIEDEVKTLTFFDEFTGGGKYKELEKVWYLVLKDKVFQNFIDDESNLCETSEKELREKYGINITSFNSEDINNLVEVITGTDETITLYRKYINGERKLVFNDENNITEKTLATAYRVEQSILYQFLLYRKRKTDPILVDIKKQKENRVNNHDDFTDLVAIIKGDKKHEYINRDILIQRIGEYKINQVSQISLDEFASFWDKLDEYWESDQKTILEWLIHGRNSHDKDYYNIDGELLTDERWESEGFIYHNESNGRDIGIPVGIADSLVRTINEIEIMKKEYEEKNIHEKPISDNTDINKIYWPIINEEVGMHIVELLNTLLCPFQDSAGRTKNGIKYTQTTKLSEVIEVEQKEQIINKMLEVNINWRQLVWENIEEFENMDLQHNSLRILSTLSKILANSNDKVSAIQRLEISGTDDTQSIAIARFIQKIAVASAKKQGTLLDKDQETKDNLLAQGWIYTTAYELHYFFRYILSEDKLGRYIYNELGKESMFTKSKVDVDNLDLKGMVNTLGNYGISRVAKLIEDFSKILLYVTPEQQKRLLHYLNEGIYNEEDIHLILHLTHFSHKTSLTGIDEESQMILSIAYEYFQLLHSQKIESPIAIDKSLIDIISSNTSETTHNLLDLFDTICDSITENKNSNISSNKIDFRKIGINDVDAICSSSKIQELIKNFVDRQTGNYVHRLIFIGLGLHNAFKTLAPIEKEKAYEDILLYRDSEVVHKMLSAMPHYSWDKDWKDIHSYVAIEQEILKINQEYEKKNRIGLQKTNKKSSEQFFNELYKQYPQDLVAFAQFLYSGGAFLGDIKSDAKCEKSEVGHQFLLSELIATSNTQVHAMHNITDTSDINALIVQTRGEGLNNNWYHQRIRSAIDGQDRGNMIYLRELVQNARDVILKHNKNSSGDNNIKIAFGKEDNFWMTKITDPIGMTPFEVWNYLLPIFVSGKSPGESTGMFGQGFYSTMVGAKEVRVKTSKGNGKTLYVTLKPIFQHTGENIQNNQIIDFTIDTKTSEENFTGTTIERIDQQEGIMSNLIAMLGVNQLQKYVGAVDDVSITFNETPLLKPGNKKIVQSFDIPGYGVLELTKMSDGVEREMKDNLYIKDIDNELLDCFPDWIIKVLKDNQLSINLPAGITLNKTRNDLMNKKHVYKNIIQPHLFRIVMEYILNEFCHNGLKIPMLPEDYLYSKNYIMSEYDNSKIFEMASEYNVSNMLYNSQNRITSGPRKDGFGILKNREYMAAFLVQIDFTNKEKRTSLKKIRNELIANRSDNISEARFISGKSIGKYNQAVNRISALEPKLDESPINLAKELGISKKRINAFFAYQQKIADTLFGTGAGKVTIKQTTRSNDIVHADYAPDFREICWNARSLLYRKHFFQDFDKPNSPAQREILETLSHELAHHAETLFYNKWSTHEKDLETSNSFESLQRLILTKMLRGESFDIQEN